MKTKILIECPELIASVRVGVLAPLKPLETAQVCELRYKDTKDITKTDIQWCDILICVRGCEYPTLRIIQAAKKAGRFLIYFLDDDLLHIPQGNESTKYYSDNRIQVNLTRILSLCDVLWVVNRHVGEEYSRWCNRWILSRVPAVPLCRPIRPRSQTVRILYAGSVDHTALVREKLTPAIIRMLKEYPDRVEFVFIGANPGISDVPGITWYPFFKDYNAYKKTVLDGDFLIALAPAYDAPFYASKYYNKFIEYSSYGICGIYEAVQPYTLIVNDGENGILSGPTPENWYDSIFRAVQDLEGCCNMAERASDLLRKEFDSDTIARQLRWEIPELAEYSARDIRLGEISLPPMRLAFYQERALLLFRIYGIAAIPILVGKSVKKILKKLTKK